MSRFYYETLSNYEALLSGKAKLSKEDAERLFDADINTADSAAADTLGSECWNRIDDGAKDILAHMAYQMGAGGLGKFSKLIGALCNDPECQNYTEAARQMLDSKWAKQTPKRAEDLADRMAVVNAVRCSCSEEE